MSQLSVKLQQDLPITAIENIEEYFPLPESLAPHDEQVFMLEIMGESMIEAGILDGDYVIVTNNRPLITVILLSQ